MPVGSKLSREAIEALAKGGPTGRWMAKRFGGEFGEEMDEKGLKEATEKAAKREAAKELAKEGLEEGSESALKSYFKIAVNSKVVYLPVSIVVGFGGIAFIIGEYVAPKFSKWLEDKLEGLDLHPDEAKAVSGYLLILLGIGVFGFVLKSTGEVITSVRG